MLGLSASCASCHKDPHRGEMQTHACSGCHAQEAWKPATGFDHGKSGFPLTGRHTAVACERCHVPGPAAAGADVERTFRTVAGKDCVSCHEDAHKGRLGRSCAQCHTTAAWRGARPLSFDHGRTAYPLAGRHVGVACERCHVPGRPLRMKHDRCADCHNDVHGGQLAFRTDAGRCESCHDVSGFVPARFGVDEHAKTPFPLAGAHLAVACNACHTPKTAAGTRTDRSPSSLRRGPDFRRGANRCLDCHADPHGVGATPARMSCENCHRVESWRHVAFDHGQTRFALAGRHERMVCKACHLVAEAKNAPAKWRFAGVSMACASCHRDPHQGQFATAGATSCERCHTADDTRATGFDHGRDSAYPLDGAHKSLACAACHRTETKDGRSLVRYKPLAKTCRGCHGKSGPSGAGGRP
jgi:hypothetical protein